MILCLVIVLPGAKTMIPVMILMKLIYFLGNIPNKELINYINKNYDTKNNNFIKLIDNPSRIKIAKYDENILFCDGFDKALMGVRLGFNNKKNLAVYDYYECIKILMHEQSWDRDEAQEYLDFNTVGAYVGEYTPCFVYLL